MSNTMNVFCELSAQHITQMLGTMDDYREEKKKSIKNSFYT